MEPTFILLGYVLPVTALLFSGYRWLGQRKIDRTVRKLRRDVNNLANGPKDCPNCGHKL